MCLSVWTPKIINFPFGTNEKLVMLDVPVLMNNMVPTKHKLPLFLELISHSDLFPYVSLLK